MINIRYTVNDGIELTMDGHADYAEPGKDIVCAATTILARTLAEEVQQCDDHALVDLSPGHAYIRSCGKNAADALRVVVTGFRLLAQNYPDMVRIG